MSILDPRIWLAAIIALAAAFGLGYWRGDAAATRHERNACLAGHAALQAAQSKATIAAQDNFAKQQEQAHAQHTQDLARARADARAAAAAADGLRKQLYDARSRIATAPQSAVAEYAAAATDVFEQCTDRYRALAEQADGHVADVRALTAALPKPMTFSDAVK